MSDILLKNCPYCGNELEFDGIHLRCTNQDCEGRKLAKFKDMVALLEIKGFGPEMATKFYQAGIHSVFDLIIPSCLVPAAKSIWDKNVEKVFDALRKIDTMPLEKIIMLCGFEGVGESTAKQLALYTYETSVLNIPDGYTFDFSGMNKKIVDNFIKNGKNIVYGVINDINECVEGGLNIIYPERETSDVSGVEFTGSPKPYFETKEKFLEAISETGFKHTSLKDAKFLITDSYESTSSKMAAAKKKGIKILTYKDFADICLK